MNRRYIPLSSDTYPEYPLDCHQAFIQDIRRHSIPPLYTTNTVMNFQQALNMLEFDTAILSQFEHSSRIHTDETNSSPHTHDGRVDFSFLLKLISIIFLGVGTRSLLDFTVLEPSSGDATFSFTIWLIF